MDLDVFEGLDTDPKFLSLYLIRFPIDGSVIDGRGLAAVVTNHLENMYHFLTNVKKKYFIRWFILFLAKLDFFCFDIFGKLVLVASFVQLRTPKNNREKQN